MNKLPKTTVSSSVAINIEPPKGFDISGDTEIKPRGVKTIVEKSKEKEDEQFLELLYKHLEELEQQKQSTVSLINIVKKRLGYCCNKAIK